MATKTTSNHANVLLCACQAKEPQWLLNLMTLDEQPLPSFVYTHFLLGHTPPESFWALGTRRLSRSADGFAGPPLLFQGSLDLQIGFESITSEVKNNQTPTCRAYAACFLVRGGIWCQYSVLRQCLHLGYNKYSNMWVCAHNRRPGWGFWCINWNRSISGNFLIYWG